MKAQILLPIFYTELTIIPSTIHPFYFPALAIRLILQAHEEIRYNHYWLNDFYLQHCAGEMGFAQVR